MLTPGRCEAALVHLQALERLYGMRSEESLDASRHRKHGAGPTPALTAWRAAPRVIRTVRAVGLRRQREPSHDGSAVASHGKAAMSSVPTRMAAMAGATETAT